ncbi:MAG: hypothetical protein V7K67_02195 [Nostoc sp.]|uniref:hypothetical protein n=1 Tax=Nostoc sp. TaxID=1180 RepID=UPI002FFBA851
MSNTQKPTAIVLLGYSGVGKDTIANRLCLDNREYKNIKFSAIIKHLFSDWLDLDDDDIENKKLRSEYNFNVRGYHTLTTLLDMLDVTFRGCGGTTLEIDKLAYAKKRCEGYTPVFTDCRTLAEAEWIKYNFSPICVRLYHPDIDPGISDQDIDQVWDVFYWSGKSYSVLRHESHGIEYTLAHVKTAILVASASRPEITAKYLSPNMQYHE